MIAVNIIAAALIAVMAGLGIGGGGLLVIYLTLVLGKDQLSAQGINLCFFIFCSAASLFIHFKKRNINIKQVLILSITGIVTSIIGAYISKTIDTDILRKIFGALLIFSGTCALFSKRKR